MADDGVILVDVKFERNFDLGRHSELAQPLPPWLSPVSSAVTLEKLTAQCDAAFMDKCSSIAFFAKSKIFE